MFTFLSPLFLVGLLAAAIPLVVHLSRSRRQKKMQFSTTRFFTDQFLRSYRMSKLKEVGLLLARMALFALLAMALAQPMVMPRGRAFLTGTRNVVLVVDDSASMGYVVDGVSLLERARAAGREVLAGLRPGDRAALVLASRRAAGPTVLFPEPTAAWGDVRQALDGVTVSALGTDLAGAVARAEEVARTGPANSREVYVLSDWQRSGWELAELPARGTSEVLFFCVSVRPPQVENLSVTALQLGAARPMAGIPFAIRPLVKNQSPGARGTEVALYVEGQKVAQQRLEPIAPGRWAAPLLHHTFARGGWQRGYVEIVDENFAADNRRYFAFDVLAAISVLAVNGAPSQVARLDELFFLKTALGATGTDKSAVQVTEVGPGGVAEALAATRPGLVILANVESLAPAAVEKLEEYVDRGGALWVFLGDRVEARFYNEFLAAPSRLHGGLLPARLTTVETNTLTIGAMDYENPALAAFADPRFATLTGVELRRSWGLELPEGGALMVANTGAPLLCEKPFGKGRVMLFASSGDRDWNNFAVRPAFLPWVHRLVGYLAQEPLGRQPFYVTGQPVPVPVAATEGAEPVLIKKPDGTMGHATPTDDPDMPLAFTDATQLGVYAVAPTGSLFVANLAGVESDLSYRTEQFAELLPGRPLVTYVDDPSRLGEASLNARRGFQLWDWMLAVVLGLALLEPWWANRISLKHYSQPTQPKREPAS